MISPVRFSAANSKLKRLHAVPQVRRFLQNGRKVYSFDLLSGWTCPGAHDCQSFAHLHEDGTRSIHDGQWTMFRCFSASQEARLRDVFNLRKGNTDALRGKTAAQILPMLREALPHNAGIVRIHVAGDFFSAQYMRAWIELARERPDIRFYAYTKSLKYLAAWQDAIPDNLKLTISIGGRYDDLIPQLTQFHCARVVYHPTAAQRLGLSIDHTDEHAAIGKESFALLLHGQQPAGSEASKAQQRMKREGITFAYSS